MGLMTLTIPNEMVEQLQRYSDEEWKRRAKAAMQLMFPEEKWPKSPKELRPAVFLDRDGVLNKYLPGDYVKTPDELEILPGVGAAIRRLNEAGYLVFLISNQQGVAKGLMSEADLDALDSVLRERLAADGAKITQTYYCPHSAGTCDCRKPRIGNILDAVRRYDVAMADSVFIGDTETDARAARAAQLGRFFLVLTGKYTDPAVGDDWRLFDEPPDGTYPDLAAAVDALLTEDAAEGA